MSGPPGVVVLYDGDCRFCRAAAAALAGWDRAGRLAVVPFRDPLGAALARSVPEGRRFGSLHARGPDGRLASGPDALALVLGRLPGGRVLRARRASRTCTGRWRDGGAGSAAWCPTARRCGACRRPSAMRVAGIDLGGRGAGTTALAVMEERDGVPHLVSIAAGPGLRGTRGDAELVRACAGAGVARVAVDAPLSLPHAVTCREAGCPRCLGGDVSPVTGSRFADRADAWAAAGHPEKPPMATAMIAGIAFRAIHLARRFAAAGIACDETWPMGTYRALLRASGHAGPVPDDLRRRALTAVVAGLGDALAGAAVPAPAHRDALDAVAAAYCAWAITAGRARWVGDPAEGVIWVAGAPQAR